MVDVRREPYRMDDHQHLPFTTVCVELTIPPLEVATQLADKRYSALTGQEDARISDFYDLDHYEANKKMAEIGLARGYQRTFQSPGPDYYREMTEDDFHSEASVHLINSIAADEELKLVTFTLNRKDELLPQPGLDPFVAQRVADATQILGSSPFTQVEMRCLQSHMQMAVVPTQAVANMERYVAGYGLVWSQVTDDDYELLDVKLDGRCISLAEQLVARCMLSFPELVEASTLEAIKCIAGTPLEGHDADRLMAMASIYIDEDSQKYGLHLPWAHLPEYIASTRSHCEPDDYQRRFSISIEDAYSSNLTNALDAVTEHSRQLRTLPSLALERYDSEHARMRIAVVGALESIAATRNAYDTVDCFAVLSQARGGWLNDDQKVDRNDDLLARLQSGSPHSDELANVIENLRSSPASALESMRASVNAPSVGNLVLARDGHNPNVKFAVGHVETIHDGNAERAQPSEANLHVQDTHTAPTHRGVSPDLSP